MTYKSNNDNEQEPIVYGTHTHTYSYTCTHTHTYSYTCTYTHTYTYTQDESGL